MPAVRSPQRQLRLKPQPREYLRCAQCGSDPAPHVASSDHGLMLRMGQKHGGQRSLPESIGQLRHLDRGAWSVAAYGRGDATDAVSATAMHHFGNFGLGETPFRTVGSLGIRTWLAEARPWINNCFRARSQCPQENPWTTARCRTAPSGTSS